MSVCGTSARWFPASGANKAMEISLEEKVRARVAALKTLAPGSIGTQMDYQVLGYQEESKEFTMLCHTFDWMRNGFGALHGGMCATVVDQAMGFVAHCCKMDDGTAPTVQLSVDYHRPLVPGEDVLVKVKIISVSRNLMRFTAEAYRAAEPDKLCLTGSSIFFNKPAKKG